MDENSLNKGFKSFTWLSGLLLTLFHFTLLLLFSLYWAIPPSLSYHYILTFLIALNVVYTLFLSSTFLGVYFTFRQQEPHPTLLFLGKVGLDFLLPLIISLASFLKFNKEAVSLLYIYINNILVESTHPHFKPQDILLLLPVCLQDADCSVRITNSIYNCKRCGRCPIGKIVNLTAHTGIEVSVVAGGTAARKKVHTLKPSLILAVACERDLSSGISDVRDIPTIGVLNSRPNGPCYNTQVDIDYLKEKLDKLL